MRDERTLIFFSDGEPNQARALKMHYTGKHRLWIAKGTC